MHPGVTAFFDSAYCVGPGCATKSFDYDCNGIEEKKTATVFSSCSSFVSGCTGEGWAGGSAAGCGASADYTTIYGLGDDLIFRYDVSHKALGAYLYTSSPPQGPRAVSVSADGQYVVAGWTLNGYGLQNFALQIGSTNSTVEISAADGRNMNQQIEKLAKQNVAVETAPSANILDLQRRVAGVLPIRVDVPRAGNSTPTPSPRG